LSVADWEVWFVAREVWEVRFADVTLSPVYTAAMGLVSEERGLSMRFPRFIKVREDKGIDEASTGRELALMWEKQNETAAQDIPREVDDWEEQI
jgi:DNA ligase-1